MTDKQLFHYGCLLPLIIGVLIGATVLFNFSEYGKAWHMRHGDNPKEKAKYAMHYLNDYPSGKYVGEAKELIISYYLGEYDDKILQDFEYNKLLEAQWNGKHYGGDPKKAELVKNLALEIRERKRK